MSRVIRETPRYRQQKTQTSAPDPHPSAHVNSAITMTKDSERSHVHLALPRSILFFEEWMKLPLEYDDVFVPPELQPPHPDDDDDGGHATGAGAGVGATGGGAGGRDLLRPAHPLLSLGAARRSSPAAGAGAGVGLHGRAENVMAWKELALGELLTNGPGGLLNGEDAVEFAGFAADMRHALPPTGPVPRDSSLASPFQQQPTLTAPSSVSPPQTNRDALFATPSAHAPPGRRHPGPAGSALRPTSRRHGSDASGASPSSPGDELTPTNATSASSSTSRLLNDRRESRLGSSLSGRRHRAAPR